ncbi:BnaC01g44190D [Brassica napus]|uniref:BnaC01g44190D protein n=1 Tax=Brassica napus TaxID=3708 RepID=A0A078IL32_BRANA|nr:BnaC01g44190D [Brassica napus]
MDVPLYRVAPLKRKKRVMTAVIMVGRTEVKTSGLLNEVTSKSRVNSHLVPTGKIRFQLIGQRFCVMATTNACDADTLLPPRKRLLAGFKKQSSNGSSSTSYSDGSSSISADVQTYLDNLLSSQLNDDNHGRSPEELAQASKATAALAAKIAKAARAAANEKAFIASKAVAAAKSALELFASFPAETVKERLNRAIDNSPRVLTGHRNKKQKSVASTMYDGHDVAGVVDSDTSTDDEIDRTRVNKKVLLCDDSALKEKTGEGSGSSLGKRRGRVKLKKLALSKCASKDQENGIITKSPLAGSVDPLAQQEGSNGGVGQVRS